MFRKKGEPEFKFNLGDRVVDNITGFTGIVISRSQWIHNCNTYGIQSQDLKEGKPVERQYFDEPQLRLMEEKVVEASRKTGGPEKPLKETNR